MDFLHSIFENLIPADPTLNEASFWALWPLVLCVIIGIMVFFVCRHNPLQRFQQWWNRFHTSTPAPNPPTSDPTISDNSNNNQTLPGTFVYHEGDGQEVTPESFMKPFLDFTEQDVANIIAAWRSCRNGRASEATACADRTSRLEVEIRNTTRRAENAEVLANANERRAQEAQRAFDRKYNFGPKPEHHPNDQKVIERLHTENEALRTQLSQFRTAKERSVLPREVEECQEKLEKAEADRRELRRKVRELERDNRTRIDREDKLTAAAKAVSKQSKIIEHQKKTLEHQKKKIEERKMKIKDLEHKKEHQEITVQNQTKAIEDQKRKIEDREQKIKEQKQTIETQQTQLQKNLVAAAEREDWIKEQDGALQIFATSVQKQKETNKEQATLIKQHETNLQEAQDNAEKEREAYNVAKKELHSKSERLKAACEDATKRWEEIRDQRYSLQDKWKELDAENLDLKSERCRKNEEMERLLQRIAELENRLKNSVRTDAACENCVKLEDLLKKNMTQKIAYYIQRERDLGMAVRTERDSLKGSIESKDEEFTKLKDELRALRTGNNAYAANCENCKKLQPEVDRLSDLLAQKPVTKRIQQIQALQAELAAVRANASGIDADEVKELKNKVEELEKNKEQLNHDLSNSAGENEQKQIWLEDVQFALCEMLNVPAGAPRVVPSEEEPSELAPLLQAVKQKIETLKEQLPKSQAETFEARRPAGSKTLDPKIKQIMNLQKRLQESQDELMKLNNKLEPTKSRINELEDQCADLQTKLEECQIHQHEMNDEISDLEARLAKARAVDDPDWLDTNLKARLDDCEARCGELNATIEDLRTELAQAKQDIEKPDRSAGRLQDTQKEIEALKASLEAAEARLPELITRIARLDAELEQTRNARDTTQAKLQAQNEELQRARDEHATKLKDELNKARAAAPVSDPETQKTVEALQQQVDAANAAVNEAKCKLDEHGAHESEQAAVLEELKAELKQTQQDRDDCRKKDLPNNKKEIAQLQAEISTVRKELEGAHTDITDLEDNANGDNSGRDEADAAAQEKIRSLTAELDDAKVILGNSRTEAEQLKRENQMMLDSGTGDGNHIARLKEELRASKAQLERFREEANQALQHAQNETEQARNEKQQVLAEVNEKLQQADMQIKILQADADPANQNGEILRLRTEKNDLLNVQKAHQTEYAKACEAWDYWAGKFQRVEAACVSLKEYNRNGQQHLDQVNEASRSKDNEIRGLSKALDKAKKDEQVALQNLSIADKAKIDDLQKQVNTKQEDYSRIVTQLANLQLEVSDLKRERDEALKAAQNQPNGPKLNEIATELSNLRQQRAELQQQLANTHNLASRQIHELTNANNEKQKQIEGLHSKYEGWGAKSNAEVVPRKQYDTILQENIQYRDENNRLQDWKKKNETSGNVPSTDFKREQNRRITAETRVNNLSIENATLKKQLGNMQREQLNVGTLQPNRSGAGLTRAMNEIGRLQAEGVRTREDFRVKMQDLETDRDRLLTQIQQMQRGAGQDELADSTEQLRKANEQISELKAWQEKNQADVAAAEAKRAQAEIEREIAEARAQTAEGGFGTRGTTRKKNEEDSPPSGQKAGKNTRIDENVGAGAGEDENTKMDEGGDEDDEDSLFGDASN